MSSGDSLPLQIFFESRIDMMISAQQSALLYVSGCQTKDVSERNFCSGEEVSIVPRSTFLIYPKLGFQARLQVNVVLPSQ